MKLAYQRLHEEGWAHSIEVWEDNELTGGLYGLCIGKVFFGESMFSARPNTSKMAMLGLASHMQSAGLKLIDCQLVSRHLVTMGAELMPRSEFSTLLERACSPPEPHSAWPRDPLPLAIMRVA